MVCRSMRGAPSEERKEESQWQGRERSERDARVDASSCWRCVLKSCSPRSTIHPSTRSPTITGMARLEFTTGKSTTLVRALLRLPCSSRAFRFKESSRPSPRVCSLLNSGYWLRRRHVRLWWNSRTSVSSSFQTCFGCSSLTPETPVSSIQTGGVSSIMQVDKPITNSSTCAIREAVADGFFFLDPQDGDVGQCQNRSSYPSFCPRLSRPSVVDKEQGARVDSLRVP
jgi:hypothetical protein